MLQNLNKVNWAELGAAQMPNLLQKIQLDQIAIELDKKRQNAWDELRELLYPEGIIDNWDWGGPGRMMKNTTEIANELTIATTSHDALMRHQNQRSR